MNEMNRYKNKIEIDNLQFLNQIENLSFNYLEDSLVMSITSSKTKNIPAFLHKTYTLLEDAKNDSAITWSPNGVGFIILNEELLTKQVLPTYFKHSNYSSFIRQLNMYDFHKIRKGNLENYFHHDKFVRGDLRAVAQIKRKPQKKKSLKNTFKFQTQNQRYFFEHQILTEKNNHNNLNKTEITLNSVHTIKPKSQESIILMRENLNATSKMEPIYYEECESGHQNRFSQIDLNRGDSFENEENQDDDSSKMSINNEIQSRSMIEQKMQKEILIPSHNNIFHFINPYQFANFGLFM